MAFALLTTLLACGGCSEPGAPAAPVATSIPWIRGAGTWYCASEPLAAGTRDVIVKLTVAEDSILGIYALREGTRTYIGTLTNFASAGERVATFRSANSERQDGDAKATFAPDFKGLTLNWKVGSHAALTDTVLSAAADPSTCAAGGLLKQPG